MKRQFVAGVMVLASAGCAHFRSDAPKGPDPKNPIGPVGMKPVPSIYYSINRGTGNPAMAQSALGNVNDPRWSGRAPAPGAGGPGAADPARPSPSSQPAQMADAEPPTGAAPGQPAQMADARPPAGPTGNWSGPTGAPPQQMAATPAGSFPAAPIGAAAVPARSWAAPAAQPDGGIEPSVIMPAGDLKAAAAAAESQATQDPAAGAVPGAVDSPAAGAPAMAASDPAGPSRNPSAGVAGRAPAVAIPSSLDRPGGPMPEMLARPGGLPGQTGASPSPARSEEPPAAAMSPGGPLPAGAATPGAATIQEGLPPVGAPPAAIAGPGTRPAPADAAVSPSSAPAGPASIPNAGRPRPAADPLLGPNPELMPELPPLPDSPPGASGPAGPSKPAAAPASGGSPATPADGPPLMPAADPPGTAPARSPAADPPAAAATPSPEDPPALTPSGDPPAFESPSAASTPAPDAAAAGEQLADLPPLEPVPTATPESPKAAVVQTAVASTASAIPVRRTTARRDARLLRASMPSPGDEPEAIAISRSKRDASYPVARIGDEVITFSDLQAYVQDFAFSRHIAIPREERLIIYRKLLSDMIDQTLLLQEARRILKDPKHFDQFTQEIDRHWKEIELPRLEYQYQAKDEQKLREKFKEMGQSLDVHYRSFRRSAMAENFRYAKVKNKVKVELPELRKYYAEHLHDAKFDRPATIVWHEIVVNARKYPNRDEARRKIEAIRGELGRGASFEQLARTQSDGPSRSREEGGLMETSPGSYGVEIVNGALASLPTGQLSGILEGPDSFHVVRVDRRRAAGPAPFEELQDEIRNTLLEKKYQSETEALMVKLRRENPAEFFMK